MSPNKKGLIEKAHPFPWQWHPAGVPLAKPKITSLCYKIINTIAQKAWQQTKDNQHFPKAAQIAQAWKDSVGTCENSALLPKNNRVEVIDQPSRKEFFGRDTLKGSEFESLAFVSWQQPIHQSIAKAADSIEEEYCLMLSHASILTSEYGTLNPGEGLAYA